MKRVLSFILVLALLIPVFANTFVYAKASNTCDVNGASHDYSYSWSLSTAHPHAGNVECECGDIIYSDKMIADDCDICREFLCENGLHYYLANVYSAFGECYCGKTIRLEATAEEFDTHLDHYNNGYWYSSCYFCNMSDEYYDKYYTFIVSYAISNESNDSRNYYDDYNSDYYDNASTVITHTDNSHDVHPSIIQNQTHPHKGYLECSCGLRSYFEESMNSDCDECNNAACNIGIHQYHNNIYYSNNSVLATCYCGKTIFVDCSYNEYSIHTKHTNAVYVSCPLCMLAIDCSTTYYDYVTESAMSNWVTPIPDEIYYADEQVQNPNTFVPEYEYYSFNSYNCSYTSKEHDFTSGGSHTLEHPHSGYYTCWCGEELHFTASYLEECSQCRAELCNLGVHDFSYELSYTDSTKKNGYGRCYCGATMNFTDAVSKYNGIGLDLTLDKFKVPCASCTFKAIHSNDLVAIQTNKLQNIDTISNIYSDFDIAYAHEHYADVAKHKYNWNCTHSDCYLENKPKPVTPPPTTQANPTTPSNSNALKPSTNTSSSSNNNSIQARPVELHPYYQYDLPMYQEMVALEISDVETEDALDDFLDQFFLGNYAEKVTLAGTIGEIAFSFTGLDAYKDVTDLWYNISHWENSWEHVGTTLLNAVAILPFVGVFKSSDEAAMITKLNKLDPDTLALLKKIGGVNADVLLKIKKLSSADIYKLVTKLDGHALTKHVGNVSDEALQGLRYVTKSGVKGAISSFYTEEEALKIIEAALKDNNTIATIAAGINSSSYKFPIDFNYGKTTGVHIAKNSDTVTTVNKVRIVIQPISKTEFYIKTAYPIP